MLLVSTDRALARRAGRRPRARRWVLALSVAIGSALLGGERATAQDVFASSGPAQAAERARNHWQASPEEFRSSSGCCLVWLQKAYAEQLQGFAYRDAAREATGDERRELNDLANEAFARRGLLLAKFRDCSNEVQHALGVAAAGGDATGLMPPGCGPPKPDEFGSNGGLGPGVGDDWYHSRIPDDVEAGATCCVDWLDRAKTKERRALAAFWRANESGTSSAEKARLVDKAEALLAQRRALLVWFAKCVHRVWDDLSDEPVCAETESAAPVEMHAAGSRGLASAEADSPQCDASKPALRGYVDSTLAPDKLAADRIALEDDFFIDEPGVDWTTWYRDWLKLVKTQVWIPIRQHFCNDPNSYWVDMAYEVRPDHKIVFTITYSEGTNPSNGRNFRKSIENAFTGSIQNRVPAFPPGTSYGKPGKPLKRTFRFRHNAPGEGEKMTLGGPPQE